MSNRSRLRRHGSFAGALAVLVVACSGKSDGGAFDGTPSVTSSSSSSSGGGGSSSGSTSSSSGATASSSGSTSSSSGSTSTSSSGSTSSGEDSGVCGAKGSEVVMIGDSYFALSESTSPPAGEITKHLLGLAGAAGALATGDSYRYYYESGANMATTYNSSITPIPTQFSNAVAANPDIKYVLMDGGGNDLLLENTACIQASASTPISATCQAAVQTALDAANTLFQSMKTAGVEKVVYFFYPHLPTTEFPSVNVILDYAYPLVEAACKNAPLPCYFIDTRPAFNGNDASYIGPDNIHPTTAGSDAIAGLLWSEMQQACVALSP